MGGHQSQAMGRLNLAATESGGVSNAAVMAKLDRLEGQMATLLGEFAAMRAGQADAGAPTPGFFGGRLSA